MRQKWLALFVALLLLATLVAGCTTTETPTAPTPTPEVIETPDTPGALEVPTDSSEAVTDAGVRAHFATDEFLSRFDSYHEFVEDPDGVRVVITTEVSIEHFRFSELRLPRFGLSEWDPPHLTEVYEVWDLYWLDELTPEQPLVVTLMLQCLIPVRGIAFASAVDAPDMYYVDLYFAIGISGYDGSLSLREFASRLPSSPRAAVTGLLAEPERVWTGIYVTREVEAYAYQLHVEAAVEVHEILTTMEAEEVLTPFHYERQSSTPKFIIEIRYGDEVIETILTTEGGMNFFRWSGTYGDHGDPGFVWGFSEELFAILSAIH